jgi:hypothetical protein
LARMVTREGSVLRVATALALSVAWGAGAAAGVALGAVLSAVSGAGAPGLSGIQAGPDLLVAPWIVGGAVVVGHFGWTLLIGLARGRRTRESAPQDDEGHERRREDRVDGEVGAEVPPTQP